MISTTKLGKVLVACLFAGFIIQLAATAGVGIIVYRQHQLTRVVTHQQADQAVEQVEQALEPCPGDGGATGFFALDEAAAVAHTVD